ncbi:AraC family transcriptional regulator ligand-binding domain-containing protein [uncultured Sphingomonas sp.]|uniref:AraC family transcriptional regulator n=1 Tax=uncultured Sphingomonas sp. TaxID=158754 RepID=UPI0035CB29BB
MTQALMAAVLDRPGGEDVSFDIVHADALRFYPDLVADLGFSADDLLRESKIDPAMAGRPDSALEYRAFVALLARTAARTDVADFGLRLAERQRGGRVIGPIGVVMKNSKTVGQAIGYCARHIHAYSLATKVRFRPDRLNHTLFIALELLLDQVADTTQVAEHALSLANHNISGITGGRARARQVSFRHDPLLPLRVYREHFGCEVLFGQPADGITLTETDLLCEIADPDEQVYEMATSFIDQRFPREAPPVHTRVRGMILRHLGSTECTNERVASQLCMHPRTLQRRLRSEGLSFEQIKDEVRREVALRCLMQGEMPLTRVAEKLGYAETSVLSRSCYRWFEASPLQLRRRYAEQRQAK